MKQELKFKVGDKVRVNDYIKDGSPMVPYMLEEFGGKVVTIKEAYYEADGLASYTIEGDKYVFFFSDVDFTLVERAGNAEPEKPTCNWKPDGTKQRIELLVPGGKLIAEALSGDAYPSITISFLASGDTVENPVCFAEVNTEDDPEVVRVGTYYADCDEVKDIFEYTMRKEG